MDCPPGNQLKLNALFYDQCLYELDYSATIAKLETKTGRLSQKYEIFKESLILKATSAPSGS